MNRIGTLICRLTLVSLITAAVPQTSWAQIKINEILASNSKAFQNGNSSPDYIELINMGSSAVSLAGYHITDDPDTNKFTFPAGVTIGAGERLLLIADDPQGDPNIHIEFGLNDKGEELILRAPNSATIDSVTFGLQLTDFSIGRIPDGADNWVLNEPTAGDANVATPVGGPEFLRINEWMPIEYNSDGELKDDWVELYNGTNLPVLVGDLYLTDRDVPTETPKTRQQINALSFIEPLGFIEFKADGNGEDADALDMGLSSSNGETLILLRPDALTVLDTITFGMVAPGVTNISEGRLPDGAAHIQKFLPEGRDTPGKSNFQDLDTVVFNEVLAHVDPPLVDAVELHNVTTNEVDISHYWLSDDRSDPMKFQIPANTVIAPLGYVVFYELTDFNTGGFAIHPDFRLASFRDEEINLFSASEDGTLTGFKLRETFPPSANGVSFGRHINSDGDIDFVPMSEISFGYNPQPGDTVFDFVTGTGAPNPGPKVGPIVISEIMYNPGVAGDGDDVMNEYIELRNIATTRTALHITNTFGITPYYTNAWRLRDAVKYTFPPAESMAPGESIVVVSFDPSDTTLLSQFKFKWPGTGTNRFFGPYDGKLGNGGDSVELVRPDPSQSDGSIPIIQLDRVNYGDDDPWPSLPDGNDYALARHPVESYGNDPTNWVKTAVSPNPGREIIEIIDYSLVGTTATIRFEGEAGSVYRVLYQDTVTFPPTWNVLATVPSSTTSGTRTVQDTGVPATGTRYYQIETVIE